MKTESFDLIEELKKNIAQLAANEPCLKKVIIFGSIARGDFNRASDIDLAVVLKKSADFHQLKETIINSIKTLRKVDVVNLEETSEKLKKSILNEGVIIYETS